MGRTVVEPQAILDVRPGLVAQGADRLACRESWGFCSTALHAYALNAEQICARAFFPEIFLSAVSHAREKLALLI